MMITSELNLKSLSDPNVGTLAALTTPRIVPKLLWRRSRSLRLMLRPLKYPGQMSFSIIKAISPQLCFVTTMKISKSVPSIQTAKLKIAN